MTSSSRSLREVSLLPGPGLALFCRLLEELVEARFLRAFVVERALELALAALCALAHAVLCGFPRVLLRSPRPGRLGQLALHHLARPDVDREPRRATGTGHVDFLGRHRATSGWVPGTARPRRVGLYLFCRGLPRDGHKAYPDLVA